MLPDLCVFLRRRGSRWSGVMGEQGGRGHLWGASAARLIIKFHCKEDAHVIETPPRSPEMPCP